MTMKKENGSRENVFQAVLEFYRKEFGTKKEFSPGDKINYAGRIFDEKELLNLIDASLDFWLTAGRYAERFEGDLARFLGVKHCSLVNSGSSANLLAFQALTSAKLGERRIKRGDEVITVAAGFPTTVAPIIQYGAVPVFVDVSIPQYNIDCSQLERALSEKTRAVMLAHTLGNPFDLKTVRNFCDRHDLWLIEDNCIDGERCSVVKIDNHIDVLTVKEIFDIFHWGDHKTFEILSHGDIFVEKNIHELSNEFMNNLGKRQADIIRLYKQYRGDTKKIIKKLGISRSSFYNSMCEIRKKQKEFVGVKYKWSVVKNVLFKGVRNVKRITQNFGETCVTDEHRIMVLKSCKMEEKNVDAFKRCDSSFINLLLSSNKNRKAVDLVKYLKGYRQGNGCIRYDKKWIWFEYNKKCWKGRTLTLPKIKRFYREIDLERLCILFGLYCSEGNCGHELRIASTDIREIKMVAKYIRAISNLKTVRISSQDRRDLKQIIRGKEFKSRKVVYSANLGHELFCIVFGELGGRGSFNKKVPTFAFNLDHKYIKIFYDYLVKGDGCRKSKDDRDFVVTTSSLRLASGINLLNNLVYKKFSRYVLVKNKYYDVSPVKSLKEIKRKICKIEEKKDVEVYDIVVDGTSTFVDACGNILLHNCDSLGSKYFIDNEWKYTGTIGHIGTSSFYPPHHITMGEGGAVYTDDPQINEIVNSFRDWGRDCWCKSGKDNTCGRRFDRQFGELPSGYDHKYVYSHFGYNLKATDLQAAVGCAQLEKLPGFIEARKKNWRILREGLSPLSGRLILPEPAKNSDPSWFGFLITVRKDAGFTRDDIVKHLEQNGIQTRMLFAGNITKHPCFDEMRRTGGSYRIVGELNNTDIVMNDTFWIGVYPGLDSEMIEYMISKINGLLLK